MEKFPDVSAGIPGYFGRNSREVLKKNHSEILEKFPWNSRTNSKKLLVKFPANSWNYFRGISGGISKKKLKNSRVILEIFPGNSWGTCGESMLERIPKGILREKLLTNPLEKSQRKLLKEFGSIHLICKAKKGIFSFTEGFSDFFF